MRPIDFRRWRAVAKRAIRPPPVVLVPPTLDQNLGILQCVEDLPVQEFIPQLTVEALEVSVLPWAVRRDEQGPGP